MNMQYKNNKIDKFLLLWEILGSIFTNVDIHVVTERVSREFCIAKHGINGHFPGKYELRKLDF